MRKNAMLILMMIFSFNLFGQFEVIQWEWNNTILNKQIRFWENDSIKIENKIIDNELIRFQYFETGILQLKSEILQIR